MPIYEHALLLLLLLKKKITVTLSHQRRCRALNKIKLDVLWH